MSDDTFDNDTILHEELSNFMYVCSSFGLQPTSGTKEWLTDNIDRLREAYDTVYETNGVFSDISFYMFCTLIATLDQEQVFKENEELLPMNFPY